MIGKKGDQQATPLQPIDWFHKAMSTKGSVSHCLDAVIAELDERRLFTLVLKQILTKDNLKGLDNISLISQRVKTLEDTLNFRLSLLSPQRCSAWFRSSTTQNTGPFAPAIMNEAVFPKFDAYQTAEVKHAITSSWEKGSLVEFFAKNTQNSLWSMLLQLNQELFQLNRFPAPFEHLNLELLPEKLPDHLASQEIKRFLFNVKKEYLAVRRRLDRCYERFWELSLAFWRYYTFVNKREHERESIPNEVADRMREKFKQRREQNRQQQSQMRRTLSPEQEYLKFMGFHHAPCRQDLKKRYILMAKQMHPDKGGDALTFQQLTEAFKHLDEKYSFKFS